MRKVALICFLFFFSLSCTKESDRPPQLQAKEFRNINYGTDPEQRIDIYLPPERNPETTPLLVLIHGGTWSFGDKSALNTYVELAKIYLPGYAIANVNYRLITLTGNKFPVQEEDIKLAIEYLLDRRLQYNISDNFVLLGESAGAHLGLLQAYKHADVVKPRAVIDFYGPTDLMELYNTGFNQYTRETLEFVLQGTPQTKPDEYIASSPIAFVSAGSSPTMIFHGGKDLIVDVKQSTSLQHQLQELNVVNEYIYYPELGHGWTGTHLENSFASIKNFLDKHVE